MNNMNKKTKVRIKFHKQDPEVYAYAIIGLCIVAILCIMIYDLTLQIIDAL